MRRLREGSRWQLICIPFAAGAAHVYRPLAEAMPDGCEVLGIDAPGHGLDRGPLPSNFDEFATACEVAITRIARHPYVLFGHSLGGLVAYRTARRLRASAHAPDALVLSACVPPEHRGVAAPLSTAHDMELVAYLERGGVTAPELLADDQFLRYMLPILRSGLRALETFEEPDRSPLDLTTLLLAGSNDDGAPTSFVESWRCRLPKANALQIEGGHMFVVTNPVGTAEALSSLEHALASS